MSSAASIGASQAAQEAACKKAEAERVRLQAELALLQEAISTRQACEE